MTTVAFGDVTGRRPELLEHLARGERIVINEQGKPVAMLVPPPPPEDERVERMRKVIEEFKAYSKRAGRTLGGLTIREMIDEGRP